MDLFNTGDVQTLKNLKETPNAFLKSEESFFSDMSHNEESYVHIENKPLDNTPPADNPNYRDLETERANGNFGGNPPPGSQPPPGTKGNINAGKVMNAKTILTGIDFILPLLITLVLKYFFDIKVVQKSFQLTASEKTTLEPYLDEALKTVNINITDPWGALALVAVSIYASKVVPVVSDAMEKKKSEKSNDDGEKPTNDTAAPFGYEADGVTPRAPHGYTADGRIKKDGRGSRGEGKKK